MEKDEKLIGTVFKKNGKKVIAADTWEDRNGNRIFDIHEFDINEDLHKENIEKFNRIDNGLEMLSKASGKPRKEVNAEFMKNFNDLLRASGRKEFRTFEEYKNYSTFL